MRVVSVEIGLLSTTLSLMIQSFPSCTTRMIRSNCNSTQLSTEIPSVSLNICSFTDTGPVRAAPLKKALSLQLVSQFPRVVYLVIHYIISLNFMAFITSTDGTNSKHFLTTCTTGTSCSACFATFPTWTSHEYWTSLLICNVIGVLPRVS